MSYTVLIVKDDGKKVCEAVSSVDKESLSEALRSLSNRYQRLAKQEAEELEAKKKAIWRAYQAKQAAGQ